MDIFLENFRSSDTKEHVFFNPLSTSHTATCKTDFLKGDLNFFILRNTGFGLTKKDIPNDKIDLSLQYLFIGSIFNHLNIHPVTYQGENAGRIFRTVTPLKKFEHMKSSFGGKEDLGFHVDNNHMALASEQPKHNSSCAPDYLSLLCIRNDENIPTLISNVSTAYSSLNKSHQEVLCEPRFRIHFPDSFKSDTTAILPVVVRNKKNIYSRFDAAFTEPLDPIAKIAFDAFHKILIERQESIYLESGDFLIFKNQKVAHARKPFTPKYNGYDRLLIRTFGINNLNRISRVNANNPYYAVSH